MQADIPNNAAANKVVSFINSLKHTSGSFRGKPFELRDWQEKPTRQLFGTLRPDGRRQYRTAGIFLPRKNGKTEWAAAMALYMLCADGEQAGEVYCAASDRDQASIIYRAAARMVQSNPTLAKHCTVVDSTKRIIYRPTDSVLRAIPADVGGAFGFSASGIIFDELHTQPNADLFHALTTSTGAREQPLTITISTAGHDTNTLAYEVFDRCCQLRDGTIEDPEFFPLVYSAGPDDAWDDEAVWAAANPALNDFRKIDDLRQLCREAQQMPAKINVFRTWYLNQWCESAVRWLPEGAWDECAGDCSGLEGRDCYAGLDLAYRSDFAALVLVFPDEGGTYSALPYFWLPREGNRDLTREPFASFVRNNLVELTPGPSTEFPVIRQRINELQKKFNIRQIACDPWNARQLSSELIGDGFDVQEFRQNMRDFNEPTKLVEELIKTRRLKHDGSAIMRWMAANVCVESDASGNYRPSKKKSSEKIDGMVSLIMGLALASQRPRNRQFISRLSENARGESSSTK